MNAESVFSEDFEGCGWLRASKRFFVNLGERCTDFLRPAASVRSASLGLLVVRWHNWKSS